MDGGESTPTITLQDFIASQDQLVKDAAAAYPYDPKECTFHLNVGRQHLYTCRTCAGPNAICYACSIMCHTDHDLVEVGPKRSIQCDCGTTRTMGDCCSLRKTGEIEKPHRQTYTHNFSGRFCSCDRPYDEADTLYQCRLGIACDEDWFHPSCVGAAEDELAVLICPQCVEQAGLDFLISYDFVSAVPVPKASPSKKRARSFCLNLDADYAAALTESSDHRLQTLIAKYPVLVEDSEFESLDDRADESLLDGGMRALQQMDHRVAVEGILRVQELKNGLANFLESWDSSREVREEDIRSFFCTFNYS